MMCMHEGVSPVSVLDLCESWSRGQTIDLEKRETEGERGSDRGREGREIYGN
jgi:hypothetical protein